MKLKRSCWWCNQKLMAISHAEVRTPDGHTVWVHKCCEQETRKHFKPLTASYDAAPLDEFAKAKYL